MSFHNSIYETVTNRIIAELEAGAVPWTKPWKTDSASFGIMPANAITGRSYSGINIPILWDSADRHSYPTHRWLTFKQAKEQHGNVRKGERATRVVFTKPVVFKGEDDEEKKGSMLREFYVFNVAQIDGLTIKPDSVPVNTQSDRVNSAIDDFIAATRADIRHGGDKACFIPSKDFINMPPLSSFKNVESYYATVLHETGHWSGHESRLNRDLKNRFGTRAYAAEELVAEFTAAFLCAHLNIRGELRHAGYIQNWLELLKHDNRAVFTAASKASQAANYLRSFSETLEEAA